MYPLPLITPSNTPDIKTVPTLYDLFTKSRSSIIVNSPSGCALNSDINSSTE